jgi:hypothetical protein
MVAIKPEVAILFAAGVLSPNVEAAAPAGPLHRARRRFQLAVSLASPSGPSWEPQGE